MSRVYGCPTQVAVARGRERQAGVVPGRVHQNIRHVIAQLQLAQNNPEDFITINFRSQTECDHFADDLQSLAVKLAVRATDLGGCERAGPTALLVQFRSSAAKNMVCRKQIIGWSIRPFGSHQPQRETQDDLQHMHGLQQHGRVRWLIDTYELQAKSINGIPCCVAMDLESPFLASRHGSPPITSTTHMLGDKPAANPAATPSTQACPCLIGPFGDLNFIPETPPTGMEMAADVTVVVTVTQRDYNIDNKLTHSQPYSDTGMTVQQLTTRYSRQASLLVIRRNHLGPSGSCGGVLSVGNTTADCDRRTVDPP